jgi:hypothetical protein
VELISEPDDDPNVLTERKDKRKGRIWISHNRKSPDPADHVVVRTAGPVYVDLPDETAPYDPAVPQVPTTALVEVFDRQNLPRKLRARSPGLAHRPAVAEVTENVPPVAALARPDDLRKHGAIADILTGAALPPPTVTARGLKVFLAPSKKGAAAPPPRPDRTASFSGVREIVLCEQVQMNLWTDGSGSGLPGSEPAPAGRRDAPPVSPNADPPLGALGVVGGLLDAGTLAARLDSRALLLIETPGAFRYDLEKGTATFDVAPLPLPDQQNYVVATRLSAKNQTDYLVCSRLLLDLADPNKASAAAAPPPDGGGLVVRGVTALGPQVYVSVQADGLEASGAELRYARDPKARRAVTTLTGTPKAPVIAKREGSKLTAGDSAADAVAEIVTTETEANGRATKTTVVSVVGPGRLELVDRSADGGQTGVAQWGKWLKHEKATQDGRAVDLLKFEENAAFVDPQSGFSLKGRSIWLWVSDGDKDKGKPKAVAADDGKRPAFGATPERLVATGDVHLDSEDLVVRRNDKLTVWFRDVAPPAAAAAPPVAKADAPAAIPPAAKPPAGGGGDAPLPEVPPPPGPPAKGEPKVAQADPPKEPEKKPVPNPLILKADTVETWVVRYPVPPAVPPAPPPGAKPADKPKLKYELEKARCEDNVEVEQAPDPNDPSKPANGVRITGNKLTLDHAPPAGSVLTVLGGHPRDQWARVTFEGTTVFAQAVVIDQPNNELSVDGPGRLRVLSATDVAGNDLNSPSDLVVDWKARMRFEGAKMFARFAGGVVVDQVVRPDPPGRPAGVGAPGAERLPPPRDAGPANATTNRSNVWCHQLDLTLDRPVYFNQLRKDDRNRAAKGGAGEGRPKLKRVVALPNDDADGPPLERVVVYRELAHEADGGLARGRMLTAKQMDFANRTRDEDWVKLDAAGPGELRLLQAETSPDAPAPADPAARVAAKPPAADKGEVKLTVVTFGSKMLGRDKGNGGFQEAKFDDGAVVMSVPAAALTDLLDPAVRGQVQREPDRLLTAGVEPHALPKGSVYLTCQDVMTVSSVRPRRDAAADQRLDAKGDAVFRDDTRTGTGDTIRYDGTRVTLEGAGGRLATLKSNRQGINTEQSTRAKKFVYNSKTKLVEVSESSGGTFGGGR